MSARGWTTREEVIARLRRRWDSGEFLTAFAGGQELLPIDVPLRAPSARDIASNYAQVREWAQAWRAHDGAALRIEYQSVGGRLVGANELPGRVWIDQWPQLWSLLGVGRAVRRFTELLDNTRSAAPAVVDWMLDKPHDVLALSNEWAHIVATVVWIAGAPRGGYLRQIDVPGVDTKFVERHQRTLARLLDRQLPEERIDTDCPATDFIGRYGFLRKPQYVRLRWLDPVGRTGGFTEITVRVDELAQSPLDAGQIVIVENETTYLALPSISDTVAMFGGGYSLTRLDRLAWLSDRDIRYWGDIDTHGFVILDRLRKTFPHTESLLMDRATLLAHENQWVQEKTPALVPLDHLRPAEFDLYRDLVEDTFGIGVRLEQERIRYSAIQAALDGTVGGLIR